jgi:hypothetical protein
VRASLLASDRRVPLLAVRAQTSHLELKLNNVAQWMLNNDAKLATYSVLLALRANTLPLPLFGGGGVQAAADQIQIFENGSVSTPGRSVPLTPSSHPVLPDLTGGSTEESYTPPVTLAVAQCTRDRGAMDVDRNHQEGGRHK